MHGLRRASVVAVLALALVPVHPADFYEEGMRLFNENRPAEAAPVLERASREPGVDEKVFLNLGFAYYQLGRYDEAITAYRRGLDMATKERHRFLFDIGVVFTAQGRIAFAIEYYDQAIAASPGYAPAYKNRANARLKLGDQAGAISDYAIFLTLAPSDPDADSIRLLIALLDARATEAAARVAADAAALLAAEAARKAALDAVTASLLEAAGSTTNLSTGSGDAQGYDTDLSLDE